MSTDSRTTLRNATGVVLLLVLAGALLAVLLHATGAPPDGPADVAWDRTPCAECRMHVGDPRFAAQLQTVEGEVHHFDDPGCLMRWRARHLPDVHAIYYRHVHEDRWLAAPEASFVSVEPTPMGYGLGAVETDTPGALTVREATERVLLQTHHAGRHP